MLGQLFDATDEMLKKVQEKAINQSYIAKNPLKTAGHRN
jgi:hypothetical protein